METEVKIRTITDNASERLAIKWDGERFSLIHYDKMGDRARSIILNPPEMTELIAFAEVLVRGK